MTGEYCPIIDAEISPAMVQAGIWVIAERHGVASEYVAEEIATEVFRAMLTARRIGVFSPPYGETTF